MKVFSFCIYGTQRNYYDGLLENIQIIREYFPDFEIIIYKGTCDPEWKFEGENIKIIETFKEGLVNTLYRFLPLSEADIGFVRDSDSRITERDRWCIQKFLDSNKSYHIIRDHYWHKSLIMGGMFGWKKPCSKQIEIPDSNELVYGFEEIYLSETIYPVIKSDALIHTNNHAFVGEHVELISIPQKDQWDFIGNVIWDSKPKFEYFIGDTIQQLTFLRGQDQYLLCQHLSDTIVPCIIPYHLRTSIFDLAFYSNFYLKDISRCQYWLSQYEFAEVTSSIVCNSNFLFYILGKRIIASFDSTREPLENEIVIVYGNYPDWHHSLPHSSKVYRHASLFFDIKHDSVEYHSSWENISTIYILNLEDRSDRFSDTILSLCTVQAPLHRVYHYKAKKDGLPPYVGATKNHVDVIQHFKESDNEKCLILEDDVVFLDDKQHIWESLTSLSNRTYDYTLCFLAISKHGERYPFDDLLSISKQPCTTSSAYIIQKSTINNVLEVVNDGLEKMKTTNNHHTYCIDRYWTKLPNIYFFKKKLAYQRPSFSNLTKRINFNLD
jgi:GR25 family glycosyltransferase involved in LPS biosynthesis